MSEYIKREAVIDEIEGTTWYHISCQKNLVEGAACEADALYKATDIYNVIKSAPTADVVEVRHSYWQCSNVRMSSRDITCRYCHRTETISNGSEDFEYCPHCGAKMDGKDGE